MCDRLVRVGRWGLQEVPDAAGEVALEAAHGFESGLAFGALARDVVLRFGVASRAGERDAVDGCVELPIAAAVEAVTVGLARADRDRRDAGGPGQLRFGGENA